MDYVIVFLAGAIAAASGLAIWYYAYVSLLKKERKSLKNGEDRVASQLADISQQAKVVQARRAKLDEDIVAFNAQRPI